MCQLQSLASKISDRQQPAKTCLLLPAICGKGEFMNNVVTLALSALLLCFSQQAMCQPYSMDEDLQHSQLCSKAVRDFRNQTDWKEQPFGNTFTSHFNKALGKCLVMVSRSDIVSGEVLETHHIYNALEGTVLGGEILIKTIPRDGDQKIISITMVKDGKMLGKNNPDEARAAYQWFENLMKE
jgi:hypothetical protein